MNTVLRSTRLNVQLLKSHTLEYFYTMDVYINMNVFVIVQDRSPSSSLFGRRKRRRSDQARNTRNNFPHADIPISPESGSSGPDMDESDMVPRYDELSPFRSHRSPRLDTGLEILIDALPNLPLQSDTDVDLSGESYMEEEDRDLGQAKGTFQGQTMSFPRSFALGHVPNLPENDDNPMECMEYPILYVDQEEGEMVDEQNTIAVGTPFVSMEVDGDASALADSVFGFLTGSIETIIEGDDMLITLAAFLGGEMATNNFYGQCRQLEEFGTWDGIDSFQYDASSDLQVVTGTRNDLKMLSMMLLKLAEPSIGFEQLVQYVAAAYDELISKWEDEHPDIAPETFFQNQFSVQSLRKSARAMYKTIDSWSPAFNHIQFKTLTELRGSRAKEAALIAPGIALFACQRHNEHINRVKHDTEDIEISLLEAVRPDKVAVCAQRLASFPN